jgi:cytochrome c oxidase subunit 2
MSNFRFLLLAAAVLCLCGCGQGPNAPPEPVDLEAAAQQWNTADRQWNDAALTQLVEGERLYRKRCAACHLATGGGQLTIGAPALKNSAVVTGPVRGFMETVLFGRGSMPAFRTSINDADLAAILSYERNAWGNDRGDLVTAAELAAVRDSRK